VHSGLRGEAHRDGALDISHGRQLASEQFYWFRGLPGAAPGGRIFPKNRWKESSQFTADLYTAVTAIAQRGEAKRKSPYPPTLVLIGLHQAYAAVQPAS